MHNEFYYDAILKFANSNSVWTIGEIASTDDAFQRLHNKNLRLLRDSDSAGTSLTFYKVASNSDFAGRNTSSSGLRKIEIADWDETNAAANLLAQLTVLHEIGHNWDNENVYWNQWLGLSGWIKTIPAGQGSYYYWMPASDGSGSGSYYFKSKHQNFVLDYSRIKPEDDFADTFAVYFLGETHGGVLATKFSFLNSWIPTV